MANPRSQGLRLAARILCGVLAAAALAFAGVGIYRRVTYTPFTRDAIPGYMSDAERVARADFSLENDDRQALLPAVLQIIEKIKQRWKRQI